MTVALYRMEIQRNGNKKHRVVRFTEVIIMKYRHLTTGQVVLLIIGLIAILGICYALESNGGLVTKQISK